MADLHRFPNPAPAEHDTLIEALEELIKLVRTGQIETLCVVGICPDPADLKDGTIYTLMPPSPGVDVVRLLGGIRVLEQRLLDRMDLDD
jgi:hypothetical protein